MPRHYLVAPDSFKGSLTAAEAAAIIRDVVLETDPAASVQCVPMADGGEGTVAVLRAALTGEVRTDAVTGPLSTPVRADWLSFDGGRGALIEAASCAGCDLVGTESRDPRHATTIGMGQLIRRAIDTGHQNIYVALGGSATNDCGFGMAEVLGFSFDPHLPVSHPLDERLSVVNRIVPPGPDIRPKGEVATGSPPEGHRFPSEGHRFPPEGIRFTALVDVGNPLLGPQGATFTYGPQKGLSGPALIRMENAIKSFSDVVMRDVRQVSAEMPGAGAAGGLGFALAAFCDADLLRGVDFLLDRLGFDALAASSDVIITGEGRVDIQTLQGKVIRGICMRRAAADKPVIAFTGSIDGERAQLQGALGLAELIAINPPERSETDAKTNVRQYLRRAVKSFLVNSEYGTSGSSG